MNKKLIRLKESELKNIITNIIQEQYGPDYYNDTNGGLANASYTDFINKNTQPKQTGEPIVPYEKKGPSNPTSSISPEDSAKSIVRIANAKKEADKLTKENRFILWINQWGHTSEQSWRAAQSAGYAPYTSPQEKAKAQRLGYFPFPDMASKKADDAKRNLNQRRPVPPPNGNQRPPQMGSNNSTPILRPNPSLTWDQNVYKLEQQIGRKLKPNELKQLDGELTRAKTASSFNRTQPPTQQRPPLPPLSRN